MINVAEIISKPMNKRILKLRFCLCILPEPYYCEVNGFSYQIAIRFAVLSLLRLDLIGLGNSHTPANHFDSLYRRNYSS